MVPLAPYAKHVLSVLEETETFHILPHSTFQAQNPSVLPRELFVPDGSETSVLVGLASNTASNGEVALPKKKGRPSKREKMRKARDALVALEKYVDKNSVTVTGASGLDPLSGNIDCTSSFPTQTVTHTLAIQPPSHTRAQYSSQKKELLDRLYTPDQGGASTSNRLKALERANEAVLGRLRRIDQLAAEKGLEVGGEGGEKTGLVRVEQAVQELHVGGALGQRGGILGLLEGGGLQAFESINELTGVDTDTAMTDL